MFDWQPWVLNIWFMYAIVAVDRVAKALVSKDLLPIIDRIQKNWNDLQRGPSDGKA